jgi:hypothetical protein
METQTNSPVLEVISNKPNEVDPMLSKLAMSRFETEFKLEGELVGRVRAKVSKKGAVTMQLMPNNSSTGDSLAKLTGLKGDALEACRQKLAGKLKTEMGVLASRLTSDTQYEGGKVVKQPDGRVVLEWKPVKAEVLQIISPEAAMKALGIDPSKWNEVKSLLVTDEPKPEGKPENNGEVTAAQP